MSRFDPARVRRDLAVPTVVEVIGVAAALFGVTADELVGKQRHLPLAHYRQAAMGAAREITGASFPQIGRAFGRDHTTVMHAVERANNDIGPAATARVLLVAELERLAATPCQRSS